MEVRESGRRSSFLEAEEREDRAKGEDGAGGKDKAEGEDGAEEGDGAEGEVRTEKVIKVVFSLNGEEIIHILDGQD